VRYGMLEPVRQYALERLKLSDEAEEARQRHASTIWRWRSRRSRSFGGRGR
jgi:predicted ATPase